MTADHSPLPIERIARRLYDHMQTAAIEAMKVQNQWVDDDEESEAQSHIRAVAAISAITGLDVDEVEDAVSR